MIAVLAYVALVVTVTGLPLATWTNLPHRRTRKHLMPRLARALCTLTAAALLSCATLAHLHHTDTTAYMCALAAALLVTAIIREDHHAEHQPRARRPEAEPRHDHTADEAARGWTALYESCCLTGWESHGRHHDPNTCAWKAS